MLDFGLQGKTAIVCASSKGLGLGCARALSQVGVNLVMCARGEEQLVASADPSARKPTRRPGTTLPAEPVFVLVGQSAVL